MGTPQRNWSVKGQQTNTAQKVFSGHTSLPLTHFDLLAALRPRFALSGTPRHGDEKSDFYCTKVHVHVVQGLKSCYTLQPCSMVNHQYDPLRSFRWMIILVYIEEQRR